MSEQIRTGRVTLPTDQNAVEETLDAMKLLGADALRDCDGTTFPTELAGTGAKVYATYYTTRKDNDWARLHPEEIQQCYLMTGFHTSVEPELRIELMSGVSRDMMRVNDRDDIYRWWEVMDRSTGEVVPTDRWRYEDGTVVIMGAEAYHEYTVAFLAYLMWDPVHMYNSVTNGWKDDERQLTFDVRQPHSRAEAVRRLERFIVEHPYVDVIRFTTFFHQFTLVFDELRRERYVDWYGYSASVSPYILEQFEREVGYPFRAEYIVDQGYHNNQYRLPGKEYLDFMAFQRREVAALAKELVDKTHELGRQAMMFLGDHWIGTEPFMPEFRSIGLDAVVGSIGNGSTLRLISEIRGVRYTEGRLLPYFFPDVFREGGDPVGEAQHNWITARRAMLRKPVDRIGYGGYLKLACQYPDFMAYAKRVCDEFRALCEQMDGTRPYCAATVAVLNAWGGMRAWGCHMVHHALYYPQNYSYAGVIEALSGAAFDVRFISFDEVINDANALNGVNAVLIIGDGDTAHTGGALWENPALGAAIRRFAHEGGGVIGVGEPGGHAWQGRYIQLAQVLGVEKETGLTLNYDKYNLTVADGHFITADCQAPIDYGEGKKNIYALPDATILDSRNNEVQLAVNEYGAGRGVYASGLPYSAQNARLLHRAILWSAHKEALLNRWFSVNPQTELNAYPQSGRYCVLNNSQEAQETLVYTDGGEPRALRLEPCECRWLSCGAE